MTTMRVSALTLRREDLMKLTKKQLTLIAIFVPGGTIIVGGYLIYKKLKKKDKGEKSGSETK